MSNGLDMNRDWHSVGPDLGPSCLQMLSADDTRRRSVNNVLNKAFYSILKMIDLDQNYKRRKKS